MRFLSRAFGLVSTLLLARFLNVQSQACVLTVPANPLTAKGLATPYIQTGCTQATAPSFVEGVIVDLTAGTIKAYNPLVVDAGTTAAIAPVQPNFGTNTVVIGLWFGTNGASLALAPVSATVDSLAQGNCVNGGGGGTTQFSNFGQFAACNARAFFDAAMAVIANGQVKIPVLGKDFNGNTCPTLRDFGVVDQDQSDNVVTSYLLTSNNLVAQNIPANVANFAGKKTATTMLLNGSDNRLLSVLLDSSINCTAWHIPDMADLTNKQTIPTLATNELQARLQGAPVAFVPAGHAMTLSMVNNVPTPDLNKMNAYRTSVNQAAVRNLNQASTTSYCMNMYTVGVPKIMGWFPHTMKSPSPDPANTKNLAAFMVSRFNAAVGADNLNCVALLKKPSPLINFVDANGNLVLPKAAASSLRVQDTPATVGPTGSGTPPPYPAWVTGQAPLPSWDQLKAIAGVDGLQPMMDSQWGEPMIDTAVTPDIGAPTPDPALALVDPNAPTAAPSTNNGFQAMSFGIGIGAGVIAMVIVGGLIYFIRRKDESTRTASSSVSQPAVNFSRIGSPSNAMV